ncbi:uncharacterized protein LOC141687259 [Apium graveolens]|uniref:uncharacterized protein LOC141687259 n=1 Tax=Apium graveolens TaxID=4045 RepID=UPI003D793D66
MNQDGPWSCNEELYSDFHKEKDSGEFTLYTESGAGSKLPLYLSELALGDYETKRDSISEYTLKQDEKHDFHSLNVLKTMKSVKAKGTTYLITFEACLHDYKNRNPQTFQTKIFMTHPYLPTLKIDIRFVRTKPN